MKRLRLPRSFTVSGLLIFVALFCVSTFAFLEDMSISIVSFSMLKLPLMYVGFGCLVLQLKTISRCLFKKNRFYTLLALVILCILLGIVMLLNLDAQIGESPLRYTVRLLLFLVEAFMLMIVIAETGRGHLALRFLFWYLLVLVLVNDVLMFTKWITFTDGKRESYLVGTKFSVSYLHIYLLMTWMMCQKYRKIRSSLPWWLVLLIAAAVVFVAIRVDCMTGVLGCILLVALTMFMENPKWMRWIRVTSPWVLLAAILASVIFAFVADAITEIPLIKFVVEDLLKRDTSITGRTNIYGMYAGNMEGHWLAGYGYGNANEVAVELFGYQTMQNGLLQWVLETGIPSTVCLVILIMQVFSVINRATGERRRRMTPLIALAYTFIALGTVEANYNLAFLMWIAAAYMVATEKSKASTQVNARTCSLKGDYED